MTALARLWRGELPLADAFWTWAVCGGLAVNLVSSGLFLFLIMSEWPVLALIAGYGPSVPYNIAVTVGVWRAAARHDGDPRLAALARMVTLAGMIVLSIT